MSVFNPDLPILTTPIIKVVIDGLQNGQNTANTFYYGKVAPTANNPDLATFVNAFNAQISAPLVACMSAEWTWENTKGYRLDDPLIAPVTDIQGASGAIVGDSLPTTVAVRMRRVTGLGGQKARGMVRLPGIPESGTDGNVITVGQLALYELLAAAFLGNISFVDPTLGVWKQYLVKRSGLPGPPPTIVLRGAELTGWVIDPVMGHQDTRQQRSGGA